MIELPKIMVELVNPQNAAATHGIWDFIKDYIYPLLPTLLGSGIFGYVFWKRRKKQEERIKAEVQKEVEAYKVELQTTANELSQTLSEKITRRSKAFEFATNQEYKYYNKFMEYSQNAIDEAGKVIIGVEHVINSKCSIIDIEKAIDDFRKSLSDIRFISLSSYFILHPRLMTCIDEFINVLFEYGLKAGMAISTDVNSLDEIKKEMDDILTKISKKCAKVKYAISVIVKAESDGEDPNQKLALINDCD